MPENLPDLPENVIVLTSEEKTRFRHWLLQEALISEGVMEASKRLSPILCEAVQQAEEPYQAACRIVAQRIAAVEEQSV